MIAMLRLARSEMMFAWNHGVQRKLLVFWSLYPVWTVVSGVAATITAIAVQDPAKGASAFVALAIAPTIGLGLLTWYSLSVRIWAWHALGRTEHRRRLSAWHDKAPEYRVPVNGREVFWCWSDRAAADTGAQACRRESCVIPKLHTELDCMPPVAAKMLEGPGEPSGVFFQMIEPWEIRQMNRKRFRQSVAQQIAKYGPVAAVSIGLWFMVFLF